MTRICLAIATALFATTSLFATAAEACISCEYNPQVVNTPNPHAKRHQPKRGQAAKKPRAPAAAKSQAARKSQQPAKAARKTPEPKAAVAKSEPVEKEVVKTQAETAETGPRLTGSSALMQQSLPKEEQPVAAADAEHACKKFIPAVGATVSVPCE